MIGKHVRLCSRESDCLTFNGFMKSASRAGLEYFIRKTKEVNNIYRKFGLKMIIHFKKFDVSSRVEKVARQPHLKMAGCSSAVKT